jgi:ribosomal protein S27E
MEDESCTNRVAVVIHSHTQSTATCSICAEICHGSEVTGYLQLTKHAATMIDVTRRATVNTSCSQ